jgi:GntR family transcriptional regulator
MKAEPGVGTIDADSPTPKYSQLRQILLDLIDTELQVDQILPSERDIADRFGIARMTVRQAVDQLVAEGRVYKVLGKGAFVARPRLVMPLTLTSFTRDMQDRGLRPGSVEIDRRLVEADHELSTVMQVDPGEPLHVLERLRLADGEPLAVERSHLVARRTPGLLDEPLADRSLYTVLEQRYGLLIDSGDQTIAAGLADSVDAALLQVPLGREVLRFRRRSLAAGAPLEYAVSTYRGDRYQLQVSFGPGAPPAGTTGRT